MDRRSFLLASAAGTLAAKPRYAPKVAAQVYVWTQNLSSRKVPLVEGLPEIFRGCHEAGYRRISLLNSFVTPALLPRTQELVKQYGFEVTDTYLGGHIYDEALAQKAIETSCAQAEVAKSMGVKYLTFSADAKRNHERKSEDELALQARTLNRLGEALRKMDVSLLVHQHSPEMAEKAREWRHMLKNTDPALVGFNLDIDWVFRGGNQPLELLEEAGARMHSAHIRSSKGGVWSEAVGDGDIDYKAVAQALRKRGYTGYLVAELAYEKQTQVTRSLVEDLRVSRLYIEKTFGVKA